MSPNNAVINGGNKDLRLTFENGVVRTLRLPRDKSPGVRGFDYPILSKFIRIDVVSAYKAAANGFSAIQLWVSGKLL